MSAEFDRIRVGSEWRSKLTGARVRVVAKTVRWEQGIVEEVTVQVATGQRYEVPPDMLTSSADEEVST